MDPYVLDLISRGKEKLSGRIKSVERLDKDTTKVVLMDNKVVHLRVADEKFNTLNERIFEEAIFIGTTSLGILDCATVIFGKKQNATVQ